MDKKSKKFTYYGLGFPIDLYNFSMKKYWGEEMADIDYNTLKHVVIELLAKKTIPLTGNEVRFIRQYFKMNYTQFAQQLGQTRQAVTKWESKEDGFALITPSTELHIRLSILHFLNASNDLFRKTYVELDANSELKKKKHHIKNTPIRIYPSDISEETLNSQVS
jgi:DNA-binding transcriptional regulator YiaG